MSRIGKRGIVLPTKTEVTTSSGTVTVTGPLGTLTRELPAGLVLSREGDMAHLKVEGRTALTLWGTYTSHISNMVAGVNKLFVKKLAIEGVGFKSSVVGDSLDLALGFSHLVKVKIPTGLKVTAEKNVITVSGMDNEVVGRFAAAVRAYKKPEPYKGKGIRYADEVIRRKQGKKAV